MTSGVIDPHVLNAVVGEVQALADCGEEETVCSVKSLARAAAERLPRRRRSGAESVMLEVLACVVLLNAVSGDELCFCLLSGKGEPIDRLALEVNGLLISSMDIDIAVGLGGIL